MQLSARSYMSLPLAVLAAGAVAVAPVAAADRGENSPSDPGPTHSRPSGEISPSVPGPTHSRRASAATTRPHATKAAAVAPVAAADRSAWIIHGGRSFGVS